MSRAADTRIVVGTPERGAADLAKLLRDPVFSHHHGRDVFTDFVEIAARTVEALPAHVHAAATGTPFVEEPDTDAAFARAHKRYGQHGIDVFGKALGLLTLYGNEGQRSGEYVDLLGMAYESMGYSNPGAGQFFTPTEVCRLLARTTAGNVEAEVHGRIKAALSEHPMGMALALGRQSLRLVSRTRGTQAASPSSPCAEAGRHRTSTSWRRPDGSSMRSAPPTSPHRRTGCANPTCSRSLA